MRTVTGFQRPLWGYEPAFRQSHGAEVRDDIPEGRHFPEHMRDKGCHHSPTCLSCPLSRCVYDIPTAELRRAKRAERAERIQAMVLRHGVSKEIAATREGVSLKTIARLLNFSTEGAAL